MIPLTMAERGEPVTIRKITGKDEVRQHLAELGGGLIVQVKDARVALDRGMANRILI